MTDAFLVAAHIERSKAKDDARGEAGMRTAAGRLCWGADAVGSKSPPEERGDRYVEAAAQSVSDGSTGNGHAATICGMFAAHQAVRKKLDPERSYSEARTKDHGRGAGYGCVGSETIMGDIALNPQKRTHVDLQ